MTDFDAKLTLLHKKFHSLELGLISDILRSCGDNVDQAGSMLASMIPTEPPVDVTSLERDESDEELQKALEESRQALDLMKIVENEEQLEQQLEQEQFAKKDMSKSPDPPPTSSTAPTTTKKMNFANKASQLTAGNTTIGVSSNRLRNNSQSDAAQARVEVKDGFNLYIMRGLPGSGKTTLAKRIQQSYNDSGKRAVICSADDYFTDANGRYCWDGARLPDAHAFCKEKSEGHMNRGFEAVIIDNTNIEVWNMIIYATMALRFRYRISIEEPTTAWKLNVRELAKRNKHGCPAQTIALMKQKWEMCSTPDLVKIARTQSTTMPPPTLINPFAPPAPVLINPHFSLHPGHAAAPPRVSLQLRPMRHIPGASPVIPKQRPLCATPPLQPPPVIALVSKQQKETPKEKKTAFQVQVQANAKNVPDAVRQAMIPADPVDPVEAKYREEMKQNQLKARSIESEKCLPTDLLDDEDAEDAADAKVTHPPPPSKLLGGSKHQTQKKHGEASSDEDEDDPEPQKPIGHGRDRSKSERHNSEHSDSGEFELSLSLGKADWAVAKLTPDQIGNQHASWSAPLAKVDVTVQADENEFSSGKGTLKLVHGNYRSASNIANSWGTSNDKATQTMERPDEHKRLCTELAGLFPDHGTDQIALAVSQSELNIDRACDYLLEGGSAVPESQSSTFDLLPDVLNAWNEKIDLDELDVGFDEFIAENHHQHYQPVTIRDSNLFSQLVSRFGQPRVNYRPSNDDYATIPGELAKQIFDWWCITMETETDDDAKMAQELADQEMAREMQEQDELKETTRRLASNQIKQRKKSNGENQEDEFPELNPNGPIHHVPHARTRGGQWISKTSLGHRDKIQKMSRLFPELPETRLEEYLRISRGNVSEATKLICALTDKNERDINQHRAKISRTKNIALSAPPAVTTTADCLGDNVETSAAEWTYDQMRSESVDLFRQAERVKQKASEHAQRNEGHTAQYYAHEASQLRERAMEAQARSAEHIFARNNAKYRGDGVIDLHGLHINEGLKKLQSRIRQCNSQELQVITGRGQNSAHGYGKMRKAVESYFHSNGYSFCRHSENQGVLRVKLQK